MLQLTPEMLTYLRNAQEVANAKLAQKQREIREAKVQSRKLNRNKREHLVSTVALMLKQGQPTRFAFEGACRHGVRSSLCLQGWAWCDADAAAASVVSAALNRIGAERPTWAQGQPGYTEEGFAPVQYTRCVHCHSNIGDEVVSGKFCSELCRNANYQQIYRQFDLRVSLAERHAIKAADAEHNRKQREMDCEHCGKVFTRLLGKKSQRFCSPECAHEASKTERRRIADKACLQCGTMFRPKSDASKYCSATCMGQAFSAAMRRPPTTCEACGKKFRAVIPTRKFCSIECRAVGLRGRPEQPCANCGTMFKPKMSKGKVSQYCSRACSGMAHRKEVSDVLRPRP